MARIDARLGQMPNEAAVATAQPAPARWRIGDRALAASGWNGTIAELDEARGRAVLQVSGMRVEVGMDELEPTSGVAAGGGTGSGGRPKTGRRGEFGDEPRSAFATGAAKSRAAAVGTRRARAVASSLDLRGARVEEAMEMLDQYLDDATHAGAARLTVIHGHGSGAMRDAVRAMLSGHPLVREWRPGDRGEGGDGATVITL
jgi:dsDNA-specific endonuclease/ATPase MutS2